MPVHRTNQAPRRATVLVAVLVVIVVLTLAAYRYGDWMSGEANAADSAVRAAQARALADSGVHYAAALLADKNNTSVAGNPYDNAGLFQDVSVPGSPRNGRFSLFALRSPDDPAGSGFRHGVTDEAGKINLNALLALDRGQGNLAKQILMDLPNMTDEISDAILDWLDPDDTPRANGAESDYYQSQSPAYSAKNGPLDSLEELLLVRGVTPQLLFGNDRNRNGALDAGEDDGGGQVDMGWSAYLTVYSREPNIDSQGNARVWVNDPDLNNLATNLSSTSVDPNLANYIIAYRMYGPAGTMSVSTVLVRTAPTPPTRGTGMAATDRTTVMTQVQSDRSRGGPSGGGGAGGGSGGAGGRGGGGGGGGRQNNINSLFSLINTSVNVPSGNRTIAYPSPLNDPSQLPQMLPALLDCCTTSNSPELNPRININTASQTVLNALVDATGLQPSDIQSILSARPANGANSDSTFNTPAWLLTQANVPLATMRKLETIISARTQVYRVQSVGYTDGNGPAARVEAVFDTNQGRPRIVYWRDLTELGVGFDIRGNNNQ
jgi:type II secretory pathway component PulK